MHNLSSLADEIASDFKPSSTLTNSESDSTLSESPDREKKYKCKIMGCGKRFRFPSELQRHELMHSNHRPFACPIKKCNKSFKRLDILKNHMKVHTKETPYMCPQVHCGKKFSNRAALTYHLQKQGCQKCAKQDDECRSIFSALRSNTCSNEEVTVETPTEETYVYEGLDIFSTHTKQEAIETQSYPMAVDQTWALKDGLQFLVPVEEKTQSVDLMRLMKENELLKSRLEENFKRITMMQSQMQMQNQMQMQVPMMVVQEPQYPCFESNEFFMDCNQRGFEYGFNFGEY